jgi:hypothetical protein
MMITIAQRSSILKIQNPQKVLILTEKFPFSSKYLNSWRSIFAPVGFLTTNQVSLFVCVVYLFVPSPSFLKGQTSEMKTFLKV